MKRKKGALLPFLVLFVSIVTCSAPQTPAPGTPASPAEQPTPTPTPSRPTEKPTTTPTVQPTETPTPISPTPEAAHIYFEPGATSQTLSGHLDPNELERYALRALAGQVMHVRVSSAEESVRLRLEAPYGTPLEGQAEGATFWRGPLPFTHDYFIVLSSQEAADYELSVIVYARIAFEPGETSTTLSGRLRDHETDHYVLRAQEGQALDVVVEAPEQVGLAVVGADGVPLKRYVDEEMSWRGELPLTQDYFVEVNALETTSYTLTIRLPPLSSEASIKVISPNGAEEWLEGSTHELAWRSSDVAKIDIEVASGGKPLGHVALAVDTTSGRYPWKIPVGLISNFGVAASDAMRVRISSSEDPSVYDENDDAFTVRCPRIQFQAGAASSSVTGTLDADSNRFRYVLDAAAGQTVEIHISPAQVGIDVWGAEDGSTWELPAAGKSDLIIPSLPRSQDYFITLISAAGTEAIDYTLEVAVR